jgi:3-oxoadipate enol-lactonase
MRNTLEITGMAARASDSYLETSGVRLRYRDEGRGCAVIFVHGWTLDLDQWESQAAALTGQFRVVRLDRRGFGSSSGLPSIAGDGTDLLALCQHLGLDSAALVGMSQGARVVLEFAKSHPRLTSCLVLDGPPHLGTPEAKDSSHDIPYEHYRELAQTQGLCAFRREWSEHALARLRTVDPEAHALLGRMIARYPGRDLTDPGGHADAMPLVQGFESVARPALVVNGEFDLESRKRIAGRLALQLPRVECVEIPNAGHLCNLDNPRAYNDALKRFLERHASPSQASLSTDH